MRKNTEDITVGNTIRAYGQTVLVEFIDPFGNGFAFVGDRGQHVILFPGESAELLA